jgi:hypothetical protein
VKLRGVHAGLLEEAEPVVGERGVFFWKDDVATMLDAICTTTGEEGRYALKPVTGTEFAAVADDAGVIKSATLEGFGFFQPINEPGKEFNDLLCAVAFIWCLCSLKHGPSHGLWE